MYENIITTIGEILENDGITWEQLATNADIDVDRVLNISALRDEPMDVKEMLRFARALEVEPSDLVPSISSGARV